MLKIIIITILTALGFNPNPVPKHSLHRQKQQQLTLNPMILVVIFVGGIILFALTVFIIVPGTESGLVYNNNLI